MKKIICLVLATIMLLGISTAFGAENKSLPQDEIPLAQTEADGLCRLGILKGTENGLELERNVTRAEALTLIWRVTCAAFTYEGYAEPSFDDISGHWAYDVIEKFYHAGYVNGTSKTTFEPERTVTGREFVKILLTAMDYDGISIENAYEKGVETQLLNNNFTKTVVYNDCSLSRSDTARLCFNAFCANTHGGKMLYRELIEKGIYEPNAFEGILYSSSGSQSEKAGFEDRLNALMPDDKNYMFSPLSIKMALAMAANGAGGQTRSEILSSCGIEDLDSFNEQAKAMIEKYSRSDILRLNISNSLWINESRSPASFTDEYKNKIADFYSGEAGAVNDDNALDVINGWVNDKTNGKIPSIISDSDFWAYLVNAIYFKGYWQNEFSEYATAPDEFTDKDGTKSKIDFMHDTAYMGYYEDAGNGVRMVKLDYKNRLDTLDEDGNFQTEKVDDADVSMYVILADGSVNAAELIAEASVPVKYVKLSLPKFKIEYDTSLNDILNRLGIKLAFDRERADFSPMFGNTPVWFTDVVHKTYIVVDEKGTEATAVTGIGMAGSSLPPEPVEFNANRPFTFVIRDNISGEVLFMGEYAYAK